MTQIEILLKAEKDLDKCETDFEQFYRSAMACYGVYNLTKALIRLTSPTIECVKAYEKSIELIKKFNEAYK